MIHLCTCTGGQPLLLGKAEKEQQRHPARRSPSGSMLSTVGLELTSLINSEKKVSKGNRSTSRRARKSVARILRASGEPVNKNPKRVDMSVSESEKAEKVEQESFANPR